MADVFICYSGTITLVESITKELKTMDISYWYDEAGHLGDNFLDEIQNEIEKSTVVLFIWDDGANKSKWCKREIKSAVDADKTIIPFQLGNLKAAPALKLLCNMAHYINGGLSVEEANLQELMHVLARCFGKNYQKKKETPNDEGSRPEEAQDNAHPQINKGTSNNGGSRQVVFALSSVAVILLLIYTLPILQRLVSGWTVDDGVLIIDRNLGRGAEHSPWHDRKEEITAVKFSDNVTRIENSLCQDLVNVKEVVIPSSVTYIGVFAFRNCGISKVTVYAQNVTLREYAFLDCESLIAIEIKEGATKVPLGAFWGCSSLETVILPESVVAIEDYAFAACPSLTTVEMPSVRSIGRYAFSSSPNLSVDIPPDAEIGKFAFHSDVMKQVGLTFI